MGTLESWLLLRSLRTFHLRVPRQSESATELARWLQEIASTPVGQSFEGIPGGLITRVWHSSLQGKDARGFEPSKQMEGGWNATFAIYVSHLEINRAEGQKLIEFDSFPSPNMRNTYPISSNTLL